MALTRGKTFTDNEQVTAGKLHTLVDDATIDASAVDTAEIADLAVTNAKIAAAAGIVLSKITAASGKLVGGSTSDTAESVTVGAGLSLSGSALTVPTDGVVTTMIADDNVTVDKLANTLTYGASAVVDYSAASALTLKAGSVSYADLATDGITGVSDATPASGDYVIFQDIDNSNLTRRAAIADAVAAVALSASGPAAIDGVTGQALSGTHSLGAIPTRLRCVLKCVTDDASVGYVSGDELDISGAWLDTGEPLATYGATTASYFVSLGNNASGARVQNASTSGASLMTLANWRIKLYYGL